MPLTRNASKVDGNRLQVFAEVVEKLGNRPFADVTHILPEILGKRKAEELFHSREFDKNFKKDEKDPEKKYTSEILGNDKLTGKFFSFGDGARTPRHNHKSACISYVVDEVAESTYKAKRSRNGRTTLELINKEERGAGSVVSDLLSSAEKPFVHSVSFQANKRKALNVGHTIHIYETPPDKTPNDTIFTDKITKEYESNGIKFVPAIIKERQTLGSRNTSYENLIRVPEVEARKTSRSRVRKRPNIRH